ncbi:integrase core domain-containing protein [Actinomadura chokoriensis]|uniref:integrase core domain-containing protein n=1 Tax=Actinomadura chokoriensis TaxID=454156 RepID=UPI0033704523
MPSARHHPVDGPGRCALGNAAAEASNSTLKAEPVHRHHFTTRAEARIKISTWIADFSNTHRRRSADHGARPVTFEQRMTQARESPPPRPAVRSAPAKAGP